jgi:regulator of protease activity HflC (stomatin/prohibitin superfamily)
LRFKLPWDSIIQYDSRFQSKDYEVVALAKGGLNIKVDMSVIWHVQQEQAGFLHITGGPDYVARLIDPAVRSTVRSTIGSYEQHSLYDGDPLVLQDDVMKLLSETLADASFTIHSILVREIKLPDEMMGAISQKFVAEQDVLAERFRVLGAVERFKRSYVDAEGVRITQSIVNEGMSEAYLRFQGIQATLELAKSANAKLVIIGDKDGLPLLLNPDTLEVSNTLPQGLSADEYVRAGEEGARNENFVLRYEDILRMLDDLDAIAGQLTNRFPEANEGIGDSTLPQDSQVPRNQRGED